MNVILLVLMAALAVMVTGVATAQPYHIMTNSPVMITGAGTEVVLVFGEAPDAQWVNIILNNETHRSQVRDGSFHVTMKPPAPGIYDVTGTWSAINTDPRPGGVMKTTGHLVDGILTVLGRGFDYLPGGTITIMEGAFDDCSDSCIQSDVVQAGDYVIITNADVERHQFRTNDHLAVESTGNLDPGETVRLPFHNQGIATYTCIYHPWLQFTIESTGEYTPEVRDGAILLKVPDYAEDIVKIGITHTGMAPSAHVILIQSGQVLEAGVAPLNNGRGIFAADSLEWSVGQVIISVSAGNDHATDTISVRPPPGAVERSGRITGYSEHDGILINDMVARPAGIIPLNAAQQATRDICILGKEALFRGDMGLAPRGSHYTEGTVWCDGVNLGIYLLESGFAITDPTQCPVTHSQWLIPYCNPELVPVPKRPMDKEPVMIVEPIEQEVPEPDMILEQPDMILEQPDMILEQPDMTLEPEDAPPAMPDTVGIIEPSIPEETCDQSCPCPDGFISGVGRCDTPIQEEVSDVREGVVDILVPGPTKMLGSVGVSDVREGVVDILGDFFEWIIQLFSELFVVMSDFFGGLISIDVNWQR